MNVSVALPFECFSLLWLRYDSAFTVLKGHSEHRKTLALDPILLECLFSSKADLLNKWLSDFPKLPSGTTLLNFSSSHDGIGLRPLQGLMDNKRIHELGAQLKRLENIYNGNRFITLTKELRTQSLGI